MQLVIFEFFGIIFWYDHLIIYEYVQMYNQTEPIEIVWFDVILFGLFLKILQMNWPMDSNSTVNWIQLNQVTQNNYIW